MKHNSNVPAFLTKLWTLVEDADTNEFICWSQEGNSFMVLDEQRFAKEILPKFFKHNNMASFIRQLNMYGFRKVLHIDSGIVKQERDGPVEFQHPHFKHGQDELLENIKRKVSNARPEENKIRQTDLTNILASVQNVHCKQEDIDVRLATLKRENEALWTEISDLRQKHSQQQQLIKKLIHFLLTLVQNNRILNLKRKRPLLMNSNGKKSKYIHELYDDNVSVEQTSVNGLNNVLSSDVTDDVIICDFTDVVDVDLLSEAAQGSSKSHEHSDVEIVEVDQDSGALPAEMEFTCTEPSTQSQPSPENSTPPSSALQLNKQFTLNQEDPVKLMDYILKENGAISQNISLLGKLELMDYLDSIDCSLEDFQAMLSKPFGLDNEESVGPKQSTGQLDQSKTEAKTDKQLIQYTSCPLLAFFDGGSTSPDLDLAADTSSTSIMAAEQMDRLPSELLDSVDSGPAKRSSLIRLEPLTEAEASEETLFYLCELSPGLEADSTQVEVL